MLSEYLTKACVQYNDYCGTAAADAKDIIHSLNDLLKTKGFDFDIYLPYSVKLHFGEPFLGTPRKTWLTILAVKKDEVAENINELLEYAKEHNNEIPTYSFNFHIKLEEFFNEFKRFEIDLGFFSKSIHNYNDTITTDIVDEISL